MLKPSIEKISQRGLSYDCYALRVRQLAPAFLTIAILLTPVGAVAGNATTASPECPPGFRAMEQMRVRIEQLHAQERVSMLNALSAEHRNLLSQVAGQLAIATNPDLSAAAKQLDAALSPSESKAILDIASSTEQQVRQLMDQTRKQMSFGNPEGPPMMDAVYGPPGAEFQKNPGTILLMLAARSLATAGPFWKMQRAR